MKVQLSTRLSFYYKIETVDIASHSSIVQFNAYIYIIKNEYSSVNSLLNAIM
jgi:hypothetical protein